MTINIKPGDTVGVIAPASPCDPEVLRRGVAYLESVGYKTRVALDPSAGWSEVKHLFSSDLPQRRVDALYQLFEDSEVKAILSVRGGYGTMELLPLIDFDRLAKNPKPFVGISDITVLLNALSQRTNVPALHGVVFPQGFSRAAEDESARKSCEDLFSVLAGRRESQWRGDIRHVCGASEASGAIVGGNLSMLSAIAGTPWEPVYDDQLLFIEDIGEKPFRIHRKLMQLKLAGALENLRGVVCGEFINCQRSDEKSPDLEAVLIDIFSQYGYPVVVNAPFGHGEYNLSFRLGSTATITEGGSLVKIQCASFSI